MISPAERAAVLLYKFFSFHIIFWISPINCDFTDFTFFISPISPPRHCERSAATIGKQGGCAEALLADGCFVVPPRNDAVVGCPYVIIPFTTFPATSVKR
jgi:hypothetical protein